jgi:hypothetical protein
MDWRQRFVAVANSSEVKFLMGGSFRTDGMDKWYQTNANILPHW